MKDIWRVCTPLVALVLFVTACGPASPAAGPTLAAAAQPASTAVAAAAPTQAAQVASTAAAAASTAAVAASTVAPTLASAASTAVAAPAPTVGGAAAGPGGTTLNVYLYQKPKNWNPLAPTNGPDTQVETLIYDALLMVNDTYAYEPRLAQTWTASPDA
ncbi:MAG: hypothetical protein JO057_00960, partial [Chloroflexi bacterium]|nr:hypothetical protein [Chloroflexota bacterium]